MKLFWDTARAGNLKEVVNFRGGKLTPDRPFWYALWGLSIGQNFFGLMRRSKLQTPTEPGDCIYVFNGCAHPQFCKDGCAAKPSSNKSGGDDAN